jgi:hypothetical protein
MTNTEFFTGIYTAMAQWLAFDWIVWLLLFGALFVIVLVIVQIDALTAILVVSMPLVVFALYQAISLGSWGIALIVILFGLGISYAINQLLIK